MGCKFVRGVFVLSGLAVAVAGCGGDDDAASVPGSSLPDNPSAPYAEALAASFADTDLSGTAPAFGFPADAAECAAVRVVDEIGGEELEAHVSTREFGDVGELPKVGIDLTDAQVEDIADSILACVPADVLTAALLGVFGVAADDEACVDSFDSEGFIGVWATTYVNGARASVPLQVEHFAALTDECAERMLVGVFSMGRNWSSDEQACFAAALEDGVAREMFVADAEDPADLDFDEHPDLGAALSTAVDSCGLTAQ